MIDHHQQLKCARAVFVLYAATSTLSPILGHWSSSVAQHEAITQAITRHIDRMPRNVWCSKAIDDVGKVSVQRWTVARFYNHSQLRRITVCLVNLGFFPTTLLTTPDRSIEMRGGGRRDCVISVGDPPIGIRTREFDDAFHQVSHHALHTTSLTLCSRMGRSAP